MRRYATRASGGSMRTLAFSSSSLRRSSAAFLRSRVTSFRLRGPHRGYNADQNQNEGLDGAGVGGRGRTFGSLRASRP